MFPQLFSALIIKLSLAVMFGDQPAGLQSQGQANALGSNYDAIEISLFLSLSFCPSVCLSRWGVGDKTKSCHFVSKFLSLFCFRTLPTAAIVAMMNSATF